MSIEKVRRYAIHGDDYRATCEPDGRYIEYADVAGLVEALRNMTTIAESTNCLDAIDRDEISLAHNELARWQS